METIIGYRWKLYYDTCILHEEDEVYDTEEEAKAEAQEEIQSRISEWKMENAWNTEYDSEKLFDIVIIEVTEEMEEE